MAGRPKRRAAAEARGEPLPPPTPADAGEPWQRQPFKPKGDEHSDLARVNSADVTNTRLARRKELAVLNEEHLNEKLLEVVPEIVDTIRRSTELSQKVMEIAERAVDAGDLDALEQSMKVLKPLLAENQAVLNRRFGTATQKSHSRNENVNVAIDVTDYIRGENAP